MKSIRMKMIVSILSLVVILVSILGFISLKSAYNGTINTLKQTMLETASISADRIAAETNIYKTLLTEIANEPIFTNDSFSLLNKTDEFRRIEKMYNFDTVSATDINGITIDGNVDLSQTEHFIYCKQNNAAYITEPKPRVDNGKLSIMIVAPIRKNGNFNGMLVAAANAEYLTTITQSINLGSKGDSEILDKNGNIIAAPDTQLVIDMRNNIELAKTDKSLEAVAKVDKAQIAGNSGTGEYKVDGVRKIVAYSPIKDTNGWTLKISAVKSEFIGETIRSIFFTIILILISIIIAMFVIFKIADSIAKPLGKFTDRLIKLSEGDISSDIPHLKSNDEIGKLNSALEKSILGFRVYVNEIGSVLGQLAQGNMDLSVTTDYLGDFKSIKDSLNNIINSYNTMMYRIKEVADIVSSGSKQIAQASGALAVGATEQSSAIQELVATSNEISEHTNKNANSAKNVSELSTNSTQIVNEGNLYMQKLLTAMEAIKAQSDQISGIIKMIDNISTETTLLSLNASIEAAKAGEFGKGFAVVANEIGKLASQSQEAAKNTANLIQNSIEAINEGSDLATKTGQILEVIVESSNKITNLVNNIAEASEKQAVSVAETLQGIQQVSSVVETNSATAEETSASSEELSSQAEMLLAVLNTFKLKES